MCDKKHYSVSERGPVLYVLHLSHMALDKAASVNLQFIVYSMSAVSEQFTKKDGQMKQYVSFLLNALLVKYFQQSSQCVE